jgi:hypothetical protein
VIYGRVPGKRLEAILAGRGVAFRKAGAVYEFESNGQTMRLANPGRDLAASARFRELPLEDINRYNRGRKSARCAARKADGKGHTALPAASPTPSPVPSPKPSTRRPRSSPRSSGKSEGSNRPAAPVLLSRTSVDVSRTCGSLLFRSPPGLGPPACS